MSDWMIDRLTSSQTLAGVPSTDVTLNISSTSLLPGNSGLSVYNSAIIHPTAHMSIGEL